MPRLLRFIIRKAAASSPIVGGTERRVSSPPGIFSTLITSAPMSASIRPQVGPAMTWHNSMTLRPASGPEGRGMSVPRKVRRADHSLGGGTRRVRGRGYQIPHRGRNAALAVRHAGELERHFDAGERRDDGEI